MAKNNKPTEKPISFYIQGIQDGTIRASSLSTDIIEEIVRALRAESSSPSQIAQLIGRSDRTVRRYVAEIRNKNALTPSLEEVKRFVGELVQKTMTGHSHCERLARSKDGSIAEKAQAEFLGWRILKELTEKLQTLGYLPSRPQEVTGDVFHHMTGESEDEIVDTKNMLIEIEDALKKAGTLDDKTQARVSILKAKIEKFEASSEAAKLLSDLNKAAEQKENKNGQEDKK